MAVITPSLGTGGVAPYAPPGITARSCGGNPGPSYPPPPPPPPSGPPSGPGDGSWTILTSEAAPAACRPRGMGGETSQPPPDYAPAPLPPQESTPDTWGTQPPLQPQPSLPMPHYGAPPPSNWQPRAPLSPPSWGAAPAGGYPPALPLPPPPCGVGAPVYGGVPPQSHPHPSAAPWALPAQWPPVAVTHGGGCGSLYGAAPGYPPHQLPLPPAVGGGGGGWSMSPYASPPPSQARWTTHGYGY